MTWPARFKLPHADVTLLLGVALLYPDKFSPLYFLAVASLALGLGSWHLARQKQLDQGPLACGLLLLLGAMLLATLLAPARYQGLLACADFAVMIFFVSARFPALPAWEKVEPSLIFWASFSSLASLAWLLLHPSLPQATLFFPNPILQGILSGAGVLLALFRLTDRPAPLGWALLGVNAAGVLAAGAKAPFLGLALVALLWTFGKSRKALLLLLAGLALALLLPTPLHRMVNRAVRGIDLYAWDRVKIWQMDGRMVADHPWTGIGPENFAKVARSYNFPQDKGASRFGKIPESPHSEYLRILVETGLPGLLWLALAGWVLGRRLLARPWRRGIKLLFLYFLLQFLTLQFFTHPFFTLFLLLLVRQLFAGEDRPLVLRGPHLLVLPLLLGLVVGGAHLLPSVAQWQIRQAGRESDPLRRMTLLQRATRLDPLNPAIPYRQALNWGALLRSGGDPAALAAALDLARRASRLDPLDPAPLRLQSSLIGWVRERGVSYPGQQDEIEEPLRQAIAIDPFNPFLHLELAEVCWQGERFIEARDSAERALELEPEFVSALTFLHTRFGVDPDPVAFRQMIERIRQKRNADSLAPGTYLYNLRKIPTTPNH